MFRKRSDLAYCSNCRNAAAMLNPRPAVDRHGRERIDWHGLPATSWDCSACGSEEDDAIGSLWQDWRYAGATCTLVFFIALSGLGVYLFGYWSWRDAGGFTGWPQGAYIWTAVIGGCGLILCCALLVGMCISLRYLWVKRRAVKPAER